MGVRWDPPDAAVEPDLVVVAPPDGSVRAWRRLWNQWSLRHSSRNLPLKLSMKPHLSRTLKLRPCRVKVQPQMNKAKRCRLLKGEHGLDPPGS